MVYDEDVLIAGAGPVGLTLANELLRHGARPRIIDRAPSIREVSRAMILHVRTLEILDKVGVAAAARAEAQPLTEVVVHAYGRHIGSWNLEGIESPFRYPLILGQNRTQHLLLDQLERQGGSVGWNTELVSFAIDDDGITARLTSNGTETQEATVRAKYIVGCEGSNSVVRKAMNFTFEGERYVGEQFIQVDCRIKWGLPTGRSYMFLTSEGYMMVIEFPDGMMRIFISWPDENVAGAKAAADRVGDVQTIDEETTLEEIRYYLTRLSGFEAELADATSLARYRTSHRYANRFAQGRALLAGDAAHVLVPIGGQGMNTGIQDAFNLGWKLAGVIKGTLQDGILETYHTERHPIARQLIEGTHLAHRGILHPSEIWQRATRMFGPRIIRNERVQNLLRNTLEEITVAYSDSALSVNRGGARGPRPGERVLDATLVRHPDRATVTLNELTRTPRWTLLLFGGVHDDHVDDLVKIQDEMLRNFAGLIDAYLVIASSVVPQQFKDRVSILLDALRIAHEAYGISGPELYLLRPDTFVGFRGRQSDASMLFDYLGAVFT